MTIYDPSPKTEISNLCFPRPNLITNLGILYCGFHKDRHGRNVEQQLNYLGSRDTFRMLVRSLQQNGADSRDNVNSGVVLKSASNTTSSF